MRGDDMKQKMQYIQTLKQTLKLNQKLLKSLDFLTDNIDDINKVIQDILETNPFLELKSSKNYDNQQFIESISNKRSLKDDLYLQLSACTHSYNEAIMDYLIESLDDSGFLSYPIEQYITDLDIDREMLDAHLDISRCHRSFCSRFPGNDCCGMSNFRYFYIRRSGWFFRSRFFTF